MGKFKSTSNSNNLNRFFLPLLWKMKVVTVVRTIFLFVTVLLLVTTTTTNASGTVDDSRQHPHPHPEERQDDEHGQQHLQPPLPKMIAISYQEIQQALQEFDLSSSSSTSSSSCRITSSSSSSTTTTTTTTTTRTSSSSSLPSSSLLLPSLLQRIEDAFGPNGLGIIEITNIPSKMTELRSAVLTQASQLAHLSTDQLEALTIPETDYTIGWSHGKEQFGYDEIHQQPIYDTRKGSFYFNPYMIGDDNIDDDDDQQRQRRQSHKNVFPSKDQFPLLEEQLMELTHDMTNITLWIARLCDIYLQSKKNGTQTVSSDSAETISDDDDDAQCITTSGSSTTSHGDDIYKSLQSKTNTKARLLYYYATAGGRKSLNDDNNKSNTDDDDNDDWCGWHKDHGSLTALLPGMLIDESSQEGGELQQTNLDSTSAIEDGTTTTTYSSSLPPPPLPPSRPYRPAGLYIKTRNGSSIPISFPPTSIGIQLGETVEIMSGGKLVATPHAVRSSSSSNGDTNDDRRRSHPQQQQQGRASLAVFLQPMPNQILPECPMTADDSLQKRYRSTFGAFQQATTKAFV